MTWRKHPVECHAGDGKHCVACQCGMPAPNPIAGCHNQGLQNLMWQLLQISGTKIAYSCPPSFYRFSSLHVIISRSGCIQVSSFNLLVNLALQLSLAANLDHFIWVRFQQLQEQCHPFLTVHAVFSCVQTKVWLSMLRSFNVCTDVYECNCTQKLNGHRKRVCSES